MLAKLFRRRPRRKLLREGDKMPADAKGPFGAMISVCPCCNRIDKIFIP